MQDCQTTQNVIQFYRVRKTALASVLADLCVKHRRVTSDDWYSLDVALFSFPGLYLFEMLLVDYDDQRFSLFVEFSHELLGLGEEIDLADSGEVFHKVFCPDSNPVILNAGCELVTRCGRIFSSGTDTYGTLLLIVSNDHLVWYTKGFDGTFVESNAECTQCHDRRTVFEIREVKIVSHEITRFQNVFPRK